MRRLEETNNREYRAIRSEINRFLKIEKLGKKDATWRMITGEEEALYGWVTANYSLRNFRKQPHKLIGFLEMGGASMQIAYQLSETERLRYQGNLTELTMTWGGLNKTFYVFTKTFLGLGADMALETHRLNLAPPVVPIMDPCSPFGYAAPGHSIVGTGSFQVNRAPPADSNPGGAQVATPQVLGSGLDHVRKLLNCDCKPNNRCVIKNKACLLPGHPSLGSRSFLGGSKFWYATDGVFSSSGTNYTPDEFKKAMHVFGNTSWATHRDNTINDVHRGFNKTVGDDLTIKEHNKLTKLLGFKAIAYFSALLAYICFHDGFGIKDGNFKPFNGVIEEDEYGNRKPVPYSWTLGLVVLQLTKAEPQLRSRTGWSR